MVRLYLIRWECGVRDQKTSMAALAVMANNTKELETKTLKRGMIGFVVAWMRE